MTKINKGIISEHGISDDEFQLIKQILQREPNLEADLGTTIPLPNLVVLDDEVLGALLLRLDLQLVPRHTSCL